MTGRSIGLVSILKNYNRTELLLTNDATQIVGFGSQLDGAFETGRLMLAVSYAKIS